MSSLSAFQFSLHCGLNLIQSGGRSSTYCMPPPVKIALCLHDCEFTQYKVPVFSLSQTDQNKAFSQSLVACDEQTGGVVGGGGGGVTLHVGKCRHI